MTTRLRYAVQYPPRKVGMRDTLWFGFREIRLRGRYPRREPCYTYELLEAELTSKRDARLNLNVAARADDDHLPGRVVQVRETITREIVE